MAKQCASFRSPTRRMSSSASCAVSGSGRMGCACIAHFRHSAPMEARFRLPTAGQGPRWPRAISYQSWGLDGPFRDARRDVDLPHEGYESDGCPDATGQRNGRAHRHHGVAREGRRLTSGLSGTSTKAMLLSLPYLVQIERCLCLAKPIKRFEAVPLEGLSLPPQLAIAFRIILDASS